MRISEIILLNELQFNYKITVIALVISGSEVRIKAVIMLIESETREKAYRLVTFSAVTFSFVAILAVFITLPMVNNYINSIHMRVQSEMEFCKILKD
ncbi:unnamed protein product [Onchocerca flexuosa]|uniref:Nematode cuticle collagen N-terminal domain-containing protein n=1 Tax=Onchocerca flexuosa TaxID=387005 RepID=A0A3P8C1S5_9BILA|nr:unnamed protein product [Onchocerca flexuosa]